MNQNFQFYQIGGFKSNTRGWCGWDEEQLGRSDFNTLAGDCKQPIVELILGIRSDGSSCLLATMDLFRQLLNLGSPSGPPKHASEFASLSPIEFASSSDMVAKLKSYKQKPGKKKKHNFGDQPQDTSQANKCYLMRDISRANFEHQRLLWRILRRNLDLDKFCLPRQHWPDKTVIRSVSCNTWDIDSRPLEERLSSPKVLDVGWTDITITDGSVDPGVFTTDILVKEHKSLGLRNRTRDRFMHGQTETLSKSDICDRLKQAFLSRPPDSPLLLLTFDGTAAVKMLQSFGVDVTLWGYGVQSLLRFEDLVAESRARSRDFRSRDYADQGDRRAGQFDRDQKNSIKSDYDSSRQGSSYSRHDDYRPHRNYPRGQDERRSRSPQRSPMKYENESKSWHDRRYDDRRRSPPPRHREHRTSQFKGEPSPPPCAPIPYPPVVVVDVQALHQTLSQSGIKSTLASAAAYLGITPKGAGWSAGNDSRLIFEMWRAMASGVSIDEQRAQWELLRNLPDTKDEVKEETTTAPPNDDIDASDDDYDPNDAPTVPAPLPVKDKGKQVSAFANYDPLDNLDDSDEDY